MTKTVYLGATLAALFAVSMMMIPSVIADDESGTHLDFDEVEIEIGDDQIEIEIETLADIPQDGTAGAFGYGVLTAGLENVLAITTHKCASDSFEQGIASDCAATIGLLRLFGGDESMHNDESFHPHILDLMPAGSACSAEAPLEVDIGRTVSTGNNVSPGDYDLEVDDNEIEIVATVDESNVNPDGSDIAVVSFEIIPKWDGTGLITNLCVLPTGSASDIEIE